MVKQQADLAARAGNRVRYDGAEILVLLRVLQKCSDEEHPLSVNDVAEKAAQLYGKDMVPGEKKIRNCLRAIVLWSALDIEKAHAEQDAEGGRAVFQPVQPLRVETTRKSGTTFYFVRRHQAGRAELVNDLAALVGARGPVELVPRAVEERIPAAGEDWPETGTRRFAEDILAIAARLRKAIKDEKAISYERVHYVVGPRRGGEYRVQPARGINDPVDENRYAEGRWPYAVEAIDGEFYVLVNATGGRDKLAPVRLAEIADLHVIDPEDPRDINGNPVKLQPARRPDLGVFVERYLDGAVFGFGSTGEKARVRMLCKGNGFHDAYEMFSLFENFKIGKSAEAKALDAREKALRPKSERSRKANPWYEVVFMAHPYGVELWAKQRVRDVVLVEPGSAAKRVRKYLLDCRYDLGIELWERQIGLSGAGGEVSFEGICPIGELDDSERKLVAAYRAAKIEAAEE